MTVSKEDIEKELLDALDIQTRELFPEIYEGFLEVEALAQGEDRLLDVIKDLIYAYWQNRNLQTLTEGAAATYETGLGLAHTGTLEERRAAIMQTINKRFVMNDATLHEICQSLAPDFTVYERTDPQALTLGIFTEEDAEDGTLPAVGIVDGIRPTVPQNLALYAGVDTAFDRTIVISHANFSALWAGLGTVERQIPRQIVLGGEVTSTSSTIIEMDTPERLELGTILFTGELRENVMPESGRSERGTILFTGELRDNVIPDSGAIEEWVNNTIELDLGFSYIGGSGGVWREEDLYSGNPQLLMPISQTDADSLTSFGMQLQPSGSLYEGPFGHLGNGNTAFNYEIVCLYTTLDGGGGSNPISIDPSDFSVIARGFPSVDGMYLTCGGRYNHVRGCRIKITKPEQ